jgi:hypothetical protein
MQGAMAEPQPILGYYLLIVFLIAVGTAIILSARKIYEFYRRADERQLARMKNWHPIFKFPITFRQQLGPEFLVLNIRAVGVLMILFAMILLGLAVRANL